MTSERRDREPKRSMEQRSEVGRRVIVTGLAGAGKSTFSKELAARSGLPLVHLDLHAWKPGWVRMPEGERSVREREVLVGEEWIADGNYHSTLERRLARADTVVFLDTPWWVCAWRAFVRGIRRPPGFQPPEGCDDNPWQQLRDEWWVVWRIWRGRHADRDRELEIVSQRGRHAEVYVLRSRGEVRRFLDRIRSRLDD